MTNAIQYRQALALWEWARWRIPDNLRREAEELLRPSPPTPSDPVLAPMVATLQAQGMTNEKRAALATIVSILLAAETPPEPEPPEKDDR